MHLHCTWDAAKKLTIFNLILVFSALLLLFAPGLSARRGSFPPSHMRRRSRPTRATSGESAAHKKKTCSSLSASPNHPFYPSVEGFGQGHRSARPQPSSPGPVTRPAALPRSPSAILARLLLPLFQLIQPPPKKSPQNQTNNQLTINFSLTLNFYESDKTPTSTVPFARNMMLPELFFSSPYNFFWNTISTWRN